MGVLLVFLASVGGLVIAAGVVFVVGVLISEAINSRRVRIESEMWQQQRARLYDLAAEVEDNDAEAAFLLRAFAINGDGLSAADQWLRRKQGETQDVQ